jgi:uncharacterized protein (DUF302 family)
MRFALRGTTARPFAETLARTRDLVAQEGFGVLCEIDVQAKMKEKLGQDMPPYLILGACAPPLAWKVLAAVPDVGVLLPCNVCVYVDAQGRTVVSAIDPDVMGPMLNHPAADEVAREVKARLQRVVVGACR